MRAAAAAILLALAAASPERQYFRYQRQLQNIPQQNGQTCLALDTEIFAHAAPQLADLRLYREGSTETETPFAVHFAAPIEVEEKSVLPLNLGVRSGHTVFDADLREVLHEIRYSDVQLAVSSKDFIATVTVSGSRQQTRSTETVLGHYTIFDLSSQRLGRSTILHLPESDFPHLHFSIDGPVSPEHITGLSVERVPTSKPRYQTIAESAQAAQEGHTTVLEFTVPAHVPVNRILFTPGPEPANFSRDVSITVAPIAPPPATDDAEPPQPVLSNANILRVHIAPKDHPSDTIDEERLTIDPPQLPWSDLAKPARWTITIDNGDDAPLQLQSVRFEMLERRLCFEAQANSGYKVVYGDPALSAPRYDYGFLFSPEANVTQVTAAPEQPNPNYRPRPDERPFSEKHPALLWGALIAVIVLLAAIALRSAKRTTPPAK